MTRNLKTQDVVRVTGTSRRRLEYWLRRGALRIPPARPLLWSHGEVAAGALIGAATDCGAPLSAVRDVQKLVEEAGVDELRSCRLVVVLPTKADVEAAARHGIPYGKARLVHSDAELAELCAGSAQVLVVVDCGQVLDALERALAEEEAASAA